MSASSRFCPYCGQSNDTAFAFCMRCGKQIPFGTPTSPGVSMTAPAPSTLPPPPQADDPFQTVFDRPLTDAERSSLKKTERTGAAGALKMLATLFGIAPLFLMFMAFMGTAFDPNAFPAVMVGTAILALILGAMAFKLRYAAGLAVARGTVREARGVPKKTERGAGRVAVQVGDIEFVTTATVAGSMPDGAMTSVVYVPPNDGVPGRPAGQNSWIVGVNGSTLKQPAMCSAKPAQDLPPPPPPGPFGQWGK